MFFIKICLYFHNCNLNIKEKLAQELSKVEVTNFRKTGAFPNLTLMTKLSYLDKSTCDKLLTKKHRCLNLIIIVKRVYKYRVVDM